MDISDNQWAIFQKDFPTIYKALGQHPENCVVEGDYHAFMERFILFIQYLIDHRLEDFIRACYRIDLDEKRVAEILVNAPVAEISEQLAALIIERQLQKIAFKAKYKASE